MTRVRVSALSAIFLALLTAGAVAAQAQALPVEESQTISLRSRHANVSGYAGPVHTRGALPVSTLYVGEVTGAISYYSKAQYIHPSGPWNTLCGTPDLGPKGDLGVDAEFVFARPWTSPCPRKLPVHWDNFEVSTDGGVTYSHPKPLGGPYTAPTPEHKYSYPLIGSNNRVLFRLLDKPLGKPSTADNYGRLMIHIRPAIASDCAGTGYVMFGEPTEAECVAKTS